MKGVEGNAALEPGFFDGRVLVEMLSWDGTLDIGLSPEGVPPEYRFQGGLRYSPGFEIKGRVTAPRIWRDKSIRIWISFFGPEVTFDLDDPMGVGRLYKYDPPHYGAAFGATLLAPKEAISFAATASRLYGSMSTSGRPTRTQTKPGSRRFRSRATSTRILRRGSRTTDLQPFGWMSRLTWSQ